jgi:phosphoribosyl-dephospho-CoA transferase
VYRRHDLLWLTEAGWQAALDSHPEQQPVLAYWRSEAWPLVVRRHDAATDPAREICAGLTLPPDAQGRQRRIGWRIPLPHVLRGSAPLTLKAARPALPAHWRSGYTVLQELAVGLDLRVYGSLAWQALTSLPCVTPGSDIDILFRPVSRHQLQAGLALLSGPEHGLPLDGEIMFPNGDAVPWKEWQGAAAANAGVLVKSIADVHMADPADLLATLKP